MQTIVIRKYQPQDWDRLQEIHDSARKNELRLAGLEAAFIPLAQAAEAEGLFDYRVDVAVIRGQVVGFVAYSNNELAWLYIDPLQTRRGIGSMLASHAMNHICSKPIHVELLVGNAPALALYESLGFKIMQKISGTMPGNEAFTVTVYSMEKE